MEGKTRFINIIDISQKQAFPEEETFTATLRAFLEQKSVTICYLSMLSLDATPHPISMD